MKVIIVPLVSKIDWIRPLNRGTVGFPVTVHVRVNGPNTITIIIFLLQGTITFTIAVQWPQSHRNWWESFIDYCTLTYVTVKINYIAVSLMNTKWKNCHTYYTVNSQQKQQPYYNFFNVQYSTCKAHLSQPHSYLQILTLFIIMISIVLGFSWSSFHNIKTLRTVQMSKVRNKSFRHVNAS